MKITTEMFKEWQDNPVTREVWALFQLRLDRIREGGSSFNFYDPENPNSTNSQIASALGAIGELELVTELSFGDLEELEDDRAVTTSGSD